MAQKSFCPDLALADVLSDANTNEINEERLCSLLSSSEISHSMQHECGVFGCVSANKQFADNGTLDVGTAIVLGLTGLQHRGQESAGIVLSQGDSPTQTLRHHRGMGLVNQVFSDDILQYQLSGGRLGIGHTRYSTIGASLRTNCQPFLVETTYGQFALAHNGELVNSKELKKMILRRGVGLSTGTDSEVMTQLLCATPNCGEPAEISWVGRIKEMMRLTKISYSVLILYHNRIYAVRDPFGNRPLALGKITNTDPTTGEESLVAYLIASESGVFKSLGGELIRDVLPGEIVEIRMLPTNTVSTFPHGDTGACDIRNTHNHSDEIKGTYPGIRSLAIVERPQGMASALCIFEYVYFSRPDTYLEGQQVHGVRFRCGLALAKEAPVDADLISVIPESATPAALGYAHGTGIPFVEVLSRNRYVGRTFIQPSAHLRQLGVATKFGVLADNFIGKRIVLVDDSIVRGTTIKPIVQLLRRYGAKEVHVRVASPPIKHPCYMGINIPTRSELIANSMNAQELAEYVGADSVQYLSVDGLHGAVEKKITGLEVKNIGHCSACLTGKYPVPIEF